MVEGEVVGVVEVVGVGGGGVEGVVVEGVEE